MIDPHAAQPGNQLAPKAGTGHTVPDLVAEGYAAQRRLRSVGVDDIRAAEIAARYRLAAIDEAIAALCAQPRKPHDVAGWIEGALRRLARRRPCNRWAAGPAGRQPQA